jgi:hypothetical protein
MNALQDKKFADLTHDTLSAAYAEWGNDSFAADVEYGELIRDHLKDVSQVLECGSGWTTLIIALSGVPYLALEHNWSWANKVHEALEKLKLRDSVVELPLVEQYGCKWYNDPPLKGEYNLVVDDGPPAGTYNLPQNRYALLPVAGRHMPKGTVILLHNADRSGEAAVARRWLEERPGSTFEMVGVHSGKVVLG